LAVCLFATVPFAEIGIHDDWSYIYTAQVFARTGHIVYNGWATAILGWMIPWGALFAKLFGASFTAVRLSMVPIALASAVLFHAVLRRFGLNASLASLATLTLCLSPPFVAVSLTFMSDMPGIFSILLCLYLCQRALASNEDRTALLWLAAACLSNVLFGTARQIAWLGALVIVPSCGWLLRRRRFAVLATIALWLVSVVLIWLCIHWFTSQPYSVPEKLFPQRVNRGFVLAALNQFFRAGLSILLFCLPVLASGLGFVPRLRLRARWVAAISLLAFFSLVIVLKLSGDWAHWRPFWERDIVYPAGIFPVVYGWGVRLPSLAFRYLDLIAVVLAISCIAFTVLLWQEWPKRRQLSSLQHSLSRRDGLVLLLPFLFVYCALLGPRAGTPAGLNDRYILPIVAFVLYLLLRAYQDHVASRPPALAFIVLTLIALVSVAGVHDRFATSRASAQLLDRLQASGVPRTEIAGGFEFDGTTQIETAGYVNEPKLVNPPGAYVPPRKPWNASNPCAINFLPWTPVIHPKYAITQGLSDCLNPGSVMSISYRTWLPPAMRQLYIQTVPSSLTE
jgi:4-amino-4-deoxy-L-arabinose transferase-like glycosyltransferase